jgi:hypothetical protein
VWLPPVACVGFAALIVLPFAALSPQAFVDATYFHHANKMPRPMLGTPQWNQSFPAQLVSLGWFSLEHAKTIATVSLIVTVLAVLVVAVVKVRDAAAALRYAALLAGVFFAFSGGDVQFFYWRVPLLLILLALLVGWTGDFRHRDTEGTEDERIADREEGMTRTRPSVLMKR